VRFSRLATRHTAPCCQERVKPCASTMARSLSAGRWMASIGTPSSVTSVWVLSTGRVMLPILREPASRPAGAVLAASPHARTGSARAGGARAAA
jgi:hypothetical protein